MAVATRDRLDLDNHRRIPSSFASSSSSDLFMSGHESSAVATRDASDARRQLETDVVPMFFLPVFKTDSLPVCFFPVLPSPPSLAGPSLSFPFSCSRLPHPSFLSLFATLASACAQAEMSNERRQRVLCLSHSFPLRDFGFCICTGRQRGMDRGSTYFPFSLLFLSLFPFSFLSLSFSLSVPLSVTLDSAVARRGSEAWKAGARHGHGDARRRQRQKRDDREAETSTWGAPAGYVVTVPKVTSSNKMKVERLVPLAETTAEQS